MMDRTGRHRRFDTTGKPPGGESGGSSMGGIRPNSNTESGKGLPSPIYNGEGGGNGGNGEQETGQNKKRDPNLSSLTGA